MRRNFLFAAVCLFLSLHCSPAAAAWHEARSRHFIIYADMAPSELRSFANRLERFDQAMRRVRSMPDPKLTDARRLRVYVMPSLGEVSKLIGSKSAAGMYQSMLSGPVVFVPEVKGAQWSSDLSTQNIFFHEYAHHLQLQDASVPIPVWAREGFAEFFATAEVKADGSVEIGRLPEYRLWTMGRTQRLRDEEIVSATYGKLDGLLLSALYARAWLLTHYLTFSEQRKGQMGAYIGAIARGKSAAEAARSAFGDLRKLSSELDRYARSGSLPGLTIDGATIQAGPIAIRSLRAAEAEAMPVHIRSRRGVDHTAAQAVLIEARKATSAHPRDAFAQYVLAEAEQDAGNFAAASAAADRALQIDPKNVPALIYKGRSTMELAKRNRSNADWKAIRSWFIRAATIDPFNAEPLFLFYQSFPEAGERPPGDAVEALLFAVELAPQQGGLRMSAVNQLLLDGKLPEARSMFAPLAYNPHTNAEWRGKADKLIAALSSGDKAKAMAAFNELNKSDEKAAADNG